MPVTDDVREVSCCQKCPMESGSRVGEYCNADTKRGWTTRGEIPEWCPLRQGPITVRLAGQAKRT